MGVTGPDISFLLAARELGASLERTLTIGRQDLLANARGIARAYADCGLSIAGSQADRIISEGNGYVDPLLRHMGAQQLDSLDASTYEGGTVIHDLNEPLPDELRSRYSLVVDGGSLEHVFNFPQALRNCMEAVALGGHLVIVTPANNYFGHGFYQFSPELFYRVLSPANGFTLTALLMRVGHRWARWYEVPDPEKVGKRLTFTSPWSSLLFVLAERRELIDPLADWPQQSDYSTVWTDVAAAEPRRARLAKLLPASVYNAVRPAETLVRAARSRSHFRRVQLADLSG